MPRKLPVEYEGALYHVMSRGDRREDIFVHDVDRQDFLQTLAEVRQRTDRRVHGYCWINARLHEWMGRTEAGGSTKLRRKK